MPRPKLKSVKPLPNAGVRVTYATSARTFSRFERPNGALTVREAAVLLGIAALQVYRLARARLIVLLPARRGPRRVPVAVCRALMTLPPRQRKALAGVRKLETEG